MHSPPTQPPARPCCSPALTASSPRSRRLFAAWGACTQAPLAEAASNIRLSPCLRSGFGDSPPARSGAAHNSPPIPTRACSSSHRMCPSAAAKSSVRFSASCTQLCASNPTSLFEFSLGVPLSQIALARSAGLLLHWLDGSIDEHELDWLPSSGHSAVARRIARAHGLHARHSAARTCSARAGRSRICFAKTPANRRLLSGSRASRKPSAAFRNSQRRPQTPLEWAELVPQLLQLAGWPGARPLSSAEYQAFNRWQQTVDQCASLGFDGHRIEWKDFLAALTRAVDETLFAPESEDAPILIAGPAESAGLTADAIWFLGAGEDAWPAAGATHPLIPIAVQREAGMPHATAQLDWDLAAAMTRRLLASAPEVHFSYARQSEGAEAPSPPRARPSSSLQLAAQPLPLPSELLAPPIPAPLTILCSRRNRSFPSLPAMRPAAPAFSPRNRNAPSKPSPPRVSPRKIGSRPKPASPPPSAASSSTTCCTPSGPVRQTASARTRNFVAVRRSRRLRRRPRPPRSSGRNACSRARTHAAAISRPRRIAPHRPRYRMASLRIHARALHGRRNGGRKQLYPSLASRFAFASTASTASTTAPSSSSTTNPATFRPNPGTCRAPTTCNFRSTPASRSSPISQLGGLVFAKLRAGETHREFAGRVTDARATLLPDLNSNSGLVKKPLTAERHERMARLHRAAGP